MKEYLEKQTSDNYVSKADAAVQDGAVVKAANTIGDNVTKLDAALAKETAARIGADAAQDKVIEQVNQNMVDGFNTINKNMADGFTALNQADAKEAQERAAADAALDDKITAETSARVAADTKLVEAVNSGVSLSDDNVLQKNTTTIDAQGNVTTSKTDANEMILNKGKDNQITMNENGIKVGTNSSVMDANGVYTGGDTYSEAKAAMSADGKIKGANGKFTVDTDGNNVITNDANGKTSTFEQRVDEILNQINSSATEFSKVDQKVDNITSEVTDGTNTTSSTQTTTDITNTATNGTISNNAKELTNTASDSITNKAENGNISNIASNGTISNEAKTISNKAAEAMTNDAKTIINTASESVTTQIGDGSAVQSVMNESGIANKATGKSITNDAATITNPGTTSVTNQVGNNKVLVDTTHVQSAFGDTIYTTWNESGITNNATDKTVATNAKDILNTATGNITNSAANGTITNTAKDLVNTATGNMTNTVGGELKTTVTGKVTEDYKSDLDTKVGENQTTTVTGNSSLTAENITNEAKNKITNKAIDVETDASSSIVSKVSNEYGSNTSTQLSYQTKEEMSQADGKTASYLRGAAEEKSQLTDGDKKTTIDTIAGQTNTNITDGTNTSNSLQKADQVASSVTDGTNTTVVNQDATSLASSITDGTKANNTNNTVDKSEQLIKASDTQYSATTKTEDALVNGSTLIDIIKDSTTGMVSSAVTDGNISTGISQSAKDISLSAAGGTIANAAQNITNTASESITNTVGKTTVTTTDSGTTFENTDHNTAIKDKTITKTTIAGNTLTTGQATMDYADVMKDLGVHGNATVDGDTSVGGNLSVTGTSTLTGDVTMKSNATVEKDLTVKGTTTTDKLVVNNGATVTGGTTTDTLNVTGESTFGGKATFKDIVTMEKDLSVGGNATVAGSMTASSYKVGYKTYIDSTGINANNQKIVNVAAGDLSASSTDAVNGAQLYQTNERVASVENRVDTVENRVSNLDSRVDKVGANAAALANLHPLEFDADSKWNIAAAVGGYKGETATAIGAFYRPNENVMVNVSSSFGTGENMYGGGISLRIGQGGNKARRNATNGLTDREKAMQKQIDSLTNRLDALLSVINPNMSKDFPDVPENHWAYEAVSKLAGNGIIQGYEDGKYHGERTMTRYEMAEIIYNALSKGAKAEKKLVEEFKPELQAMAAQKKA
ncbi:S-layer homology domain-containing protein [Megasphaera sp.]|uniref:S-layer homology domain-containing protein n=2 Tax=Megasphaera sp. TaxID=2023260 RepID=UPI00260EBE41|nr:S-layer homology domain-containing protein [uncultured Megasphaera sp.]